MNTSTTCYFDNWEDPSHPSPSLESYAREQPSFNLILVEQLPQPFLNAGRSVFAQEFDHQAVERLHANLKTSGNRAVVDWVSDCLQLGRALAGVTEVLGNGARALLAQAVHGNFCSTGTPMRSAMMAADAWCATAISRARDHDRHRPGGGSVPAGTRSHVGQGCGRIHFSSASGSKALSAVIPRRTPSLARREWRDCPKN